MSEAEQAVESPDTLEPLDLDRALLVWDAARDLGLTTAVQFARHQPNPFTSDTFIDEYRVVVVGNAENDLTLDALNSLALAVKYRKIAEPVIEGGQVIFR